MVLLYLGFDWIPDFQSDIAEAIEVKYNYKIRASNNTSRVTKNFIEKHVSDVLNNERKLINNITLKKYNITYTITRSGMELHESLSTKSSRKKKYFYNWMLMGELVSYNVYMD